MNRIAMTLRLWARMGALLCAPITTGYPRTADRIGMALTILGWLSLAGSVQAASFECAKAKTWVEKTICEDPTLSRLDENITQTYRQVLAKFPNKAKLLKDQQLIWLKSRITCDALDCLRYAHQIRLDELRKEMTRDLTRERQVQEFWKTLNCKNLPNMARKLLCEDEQLSDLEADLKWIIVRMGNAAPTHGPLEKGAGSIEWYYTRLYACEDAPCIKRTLEEGIAEVLRRPIRPNRPTAERGRYRLVHGHYDMCKKLTENLNRIGRPMRCDVEIHPDFAKDFSRPKWEPLDVARNREFLERVFDHVYAVALSIPPEGRKRKAQRKVRWLIEGSKRGLGEIKVVVFNADNTPGKEMVLLDDDPICYEDRKNYSPQLIFLKEGGGFQEPWKNSLWSYEGEIMQYQGWSFRVVWSDFPAPPIVDYPSTGYLYIHEMYNTRDKTGSTVDPICQIQFIKGD